MSLLPDGPLIVAGQPRLGQFADSLAALNLADFDYFDPFGKRRGRLPRWLHYKRFQYFGGMSERLVFGCALANLRYLGVVFIYVYDFERKTLFTRSFRTPLGAGLSLADNPVEGLSVFQMGKVQVRMGYQGNPRRKSLLVDLGPDCRIEAEMPEADFEPMSICTRAAYEGWVYANKTAGLPLRGSIRIQGESLDLEALAAYGHHDFSCGYMRRETYWNWACFSGQADGHRVGLNVSCGVNETSYTENCLWLDGQLVKVNLARFEFDRANVLQPWRVRSDDGLVDLGFTPQGLHKEVLNAGLLASNFKQVFGHFHGRLQLPSGTIMIKDLPGFVEDQYAKW